jgi:beta-lactamase regulating signal transducer with metallopeptidase domain
MIGAWLGVSIVAIGVGAILDWAVTASPYQQHGFNVNKLGQILMIVGLVGAVVSVIVMLAANTTRRRTVVDDGEGNVASRVESTY